MIEIATLHDLIVGRKWFDYHDVMVDCKRRRLVFPPEWLPDPTCWKKNDIPLDHVGAELAAPDPKAIEDIKRRDRLMEEEDRRRRAGKAAAIRNRIAELERTEPESPTKKAVAFAGPVMILPRPPNKLPTITIL